MLYYVVEPKSRVAGIPLESSLEYVEFWKGSPVFQSRILDEKTCSIYKFSQGITIYSYATILSFGDGSINEWNLCQMEHVLHSMDLSIESKFPEVFGKWPENALSFSYSRTTKTVVSELRWQTDEFLSLHPLAFPYLKL